MSDGRHFDLDKTSGQALERVQQGGIESANVQAVRVLLTGEKFDPREPITETTDINLVSIYKETSRSIVKVIARGLPDLVHPNGTETAGTGFFVTGQGDIATDLHVIDKGTEFWVTTADNKIFQASVEQVDKADDLALLKIKPLTNESFKPLALADSSLIRPNEKLVTEGHPKGLDQIFVAPANVDLGDFFTTTTATQVRLSALIQQESLRYGSGVNPIQQERSENGLGLTLMPGENPNRLLWETNGSVPTGFSGAPLLNEKHQVIGIVDLSNQVTLFQSTPVEALDNMLARTLALRGEKIKLAHNTQPELPRPLQVNQLSQIKKANRESITSPDLPLSGIYSSELLPPPPGISQGLSLSQLPPWGFMSPGLNSLFTPEPRLPVNSQMIGLESMVYALPPPPSLLPSGFAETRYSQLDSELPPPPF